MNTPTIILIAAVLILVLCTIIGLYNSFVSHRNKVEEAFALMDVYLKKRHELIPSLVATVKGYMAHEAGTLESVVRARGTAGSRDSQLEAESDITKALGNIFVVAEKYPGLKASEGFEQLHTQLKAVECDIESARRYYNGSVREFNTKIQTFPNNVIANALGYRPLKMFEAAPAERNPMNVEV